MKKFNLVQTKRSIIKNVNMGAGIGDDYGRLLSLAVATGACDVAHLRYDILRLWNKLAAGGATPRFITDVVAMSTDDEFAVKGILKEIAQVAEALGLEIAAGDVVVEENVTAPVVTVSVYGDEHASNGVNVGDKDTNVNTMMEDDATDDAMCKYVSEDNIEASSADAEDLSLIISGYAGTLGTILIYESHHDALLTRYSETYLRTVDKFHQLLQIDPILGATAFANGAVHAHAVSHRGVYGAVLELAEKFDAGVTISLDAIPVKQETIELCEFVGETPYTIDGMGAAIFVAKDGAAVEAALREMGHEAAVIGHFTKEKKRVVTHDGVESHLNPR